MSTTLFGRRHFFDSGVLTMATQRMAPTANSAANTPGKIIAWYAAAYIAMLLVYIFVAEADTGVVVTQALITAVVFTVAVFRHIRRLKEERRSWLNSNAFQVTAIVLALLAVVVVFVNTR